MNIFKKELIFFKSHFVKAISDQITIKLQNVFQHTKNNKKFIGKKFDRQYNTYSSFFFVTKKLLATYPR